MDLPPEAGTTPRLSPPPARYRAEPRLGVWAGAPVCTRLSTALDCWITCSPYTPGQGRGLGAPRVERVFLAFCNAAPSFWSRAGWARVEGKGTLVGRAAEADSQPPPSSCESRPPVCAILCAVSNLPASSRTGRGPPLARHGSACVWSSLLCACPFVTSSGIPVRVAVCATCNASFERGGGKGGRRERIWDGPCAAHAPCILLHFFQERVFFVPFWVRVGSRLSLANFF